MNLMPSRVYTVLSLALLAILATGAATGARAESAAIMILPMEINARQPDSALYKDLPVLLRDKLQERGYQVLSLKRSRELASSLGNETMSRDTAVNLAQEAGADYAVYGSLTQAGGSISLDTRLVEPENPSLVRSQSASASQQDLQSAVSQVSEKIRRDIEGKRLVAEIQVSGLKRMDREAVLSRLQVSEGDIYDPELIDRDVKKLYESGFFENISVRVRNTARGKRLIYRVRERPVIDSVTIEGAKAVDKEDILEAMETQSGEIINPETLAGDLKRVRELYRKEGYYHASLDYTRREVAPGKVELVLQVEEGDKAYIEEIRIQGADKIDTETLKDQLAMTERGFFSWFTGSGVLKEELLNRDPAALEAYYANRGFIDAKVAQPEVERTEEGIRIIFQVREGPRYRVGKVGLEGDLIASPKKLWGFAKIDELAEEDGYLDRSVIRKDTQELTDYLRSFGYAFAEVQPRMKKNRQEESVDVTYVLRKKQKVYINRVRIAGNSKTRDNVIRRELTLTGGDLFDSKKISQSKQNLQRLDYFKSVEINTVPAQERDRMDLQVEVEDKSTGSFSVGAGYSSVNKMFVTGRIQERNLFGMGYELSFQGSFSSTQTLYQLQFWNPHLFDGPLGMGFDAYNSNREYNDYDLEKTGGSSKFAYSIGDHTRLHWSYSLEQYRVTDIDSSASEEIKELRGENWSSAANISAVRDTTNRRLYPTKGSKNTLEMEYSGGVLGGDDNFVKPSYDFSYYYNLYSDFVFNWHWNYAHLFENTEEKVPDFERFYLGGINTVRGYAYQDIASTDDEGNEVGGYKRFYTNFELSYPLIKDMGLRGVVFYDAGNVWGRRESVDLTLYEGVGAGIRWNSPMGPLRLEYGYPLDDPDGDGGRFEFSVGRAF